MIAESQRVNSYDNANGTWYFIEQYHGGHWVTVGGAYAKREHAKAAVDNHNLKLKLDEQIREARELKEVQ